MVENVDDDGARRTVRDGVCVAVLPVVFDVFEVFDHFQHRRREDRAPGRVLVQAVLQAAVLKEQMEIFCKYAAIFC